jgi:hypothetical protein
MPSSRSEMVAATTQFCPECERWAQENARLREALQNIVDESTPEAGPTLGALEKARAALQRPKGEK